MSYVRNGRLTALVALSLVLRGPAAPVGAQVLHDVVRQLDFQPQGSTQILLRTDPVARTTKSANVQALLALSLTKQQRVRIYYSPGTPTMIDSVRWTAAPGAPRGAETVDTITCADSDRCSIVRVGNATPLITDDARALGVIVAAAIGRQRLEYVMTDPSGRITRVQVGLPRNGAPCGPRTREGGGEIPE